MLGYRITYVYIEREKKQEIYKRKNFFKPSHNIKSLRINIVCCRSHNIYFAKNSINEKKKEKIIMVCVRLEPRVHWQKPHNKKKKYRTGKKTGLSLSHTHTHTHWWREKRPAQHVEIARVRLLREQIVSVTYGYNKYAAYFNVRNVLPLKATRKWAENNISIIDDGLRMKTIKTQKIRHCPLLQRVSAEHLFFTHMKSSYYSIVFHFYHPRFHWQYTQINEFR